MRAILLLAAFVTLTAQAEVRVIDDSGQAGVLAAPAQDVVSLGPHLTELAYAVGGGAALVGVIRLPNSPAAAKRLPIVGDAIAIDFERIVQLKPDLVLVWGSGMNERHKARLRSLGLTVCESEIRAPKASPTRCASWAPCSVMPTWPKLPPGHSNRHGKPG